MWFFGQGPIVPVLRFSGAIGMATPLRPGLSIAHAAGAIEKAFELSKVPAVAARTRYENSWRPETSRVAKAMTRLSCFST